jgi:nitroreductase
MNFIDLAKERFSCRTYTNRAIDRATVLQLLEAARIAPSAVNYQPWHFIVVETEEGRNALVEAYPREWFKKAPLYIVACANHQVSWKRGSDGKDHADIDVAIAVDHVTLQAAALGLGSCWVCNFDAQILRRKMTLPQHIEPVVILPIGYPAEKSDVTRFENKRKNLSEIVHFEKW